MLPGALILLSKSSVAENSANGKVVGKLSVLDPDFADSFTFTLLDDAGGCFAIDGNRLVVAGHLDFEQASKLQLVVEASSPVRGTVGETFIIKIADVAGLTIRLPDVRHWGPKPANGPIVGSGEADKIFGGAYHDQIRALRGDDIVRAGAGDDHLIGGRGHDVLFGGGGGDRFNFRSVKDSTVAAPDIVADFHRGEGDKLDLRGIERKSLGGDHFDFIGANGFSGQAGELRFDRADHLVLGDVDGDRVADFAIEVHVSNLVRDDFLL